MFEDAIMAVNAQRNEGFGERSTEPAMLRGPLVVDIKGNSLDDGPGIRTVVFLKGCPLSCVWCHNPETRSPRVELAFAAASCVECGACVAACPEAAIDRTSAQRIDRARCSLCAKCAEVCPGSALHMVGRATSVDEVVAAVLRDKPFFDASGGGVTLSGGEPTQHMDFAGAVLRELKRQGVHTLVETCGLFSFERFQGAMLPWIDTIYFDLKLFDAEAHRRYCGVSNELIFENFGRLHALSGERGFELLARTPLIPGITAQHGNLDGIAAYLEGLSVRRARLLPYNPTWGDKAAQLGQPAVERALPASWMPRAAVEECSAVFERHGIDVGESATGRTASA